MGEILDGKIHKSNKREHSTTADSMHKSPRNASGIILKYNDLMVPIENTNASTEKNSQLRLKTDLNILGDNEEETLNKEKYITDTIEREKNDREKRVITINRNVNPETLESEKSSAKSIRKTSTTSSTTSTTSTAINEPINQSTNQPTNKTTNH